MRATGLLAVAVPSVVSLMVGAACVRADSVEPQPEAKSDQSLLGEYNVTVDPTKGTVEFALIEEPTELLDKPELEAKNFQLVNKGNIKFTTNSTVYGASMTVPSSLSSPATDAAGCSAGQFCAQIAAQNLSGVDAENLFIEVTSIDSSSTVQGKGDLDAGRVSSGYVQSPYGSQTDTNYVTFANGAYWYGSLANGSASSRNWHFVTTGGATFTFKVRVLATFKRTTYTTTDGGITSGGTTPFVKYDACDTTNGNIVASSQATPLSNVDDAVASFTLPFPFSIYDTTSTSAWASSNGVFGLGTSTSTAYSNATLPRTGSPRPALFPFWDDLNLKNSANTAKLCYARGTTAAGAPRVFVVTWSNFGFYQSAGGGGYDNSRMTMSLVLTEFSDKAEVIYYNPAACTTSARCQGNSATVAVQNSAGSAAITYSRNTAFLPAIGSASFPLKLVLNPTTDPAACAGGGC